MKAAEIIEQIKALPEAERAEVIDFVTGMPKKPLTSAELGALAKESAESDGDAGKDALTEEIISGFYGK